MRSHQPVSLDTLPSEVVHQVLLLLDTSDLLQVSRTSQHLRKLSLDPILHRGRLRDASRALLYLLLNRPNRSAISPPQAWIFLSKTNVLSRSISKSLIKIRLSHSLERRPTVKALVDRSILPVACTNRSLSTIIVRQQGQVRKKQLRDRLGRKLERRPSVGSLVDLNIIPQECVRAESDSRGESRKLINICPHYVESKRQVIRETLKDGLRAWVESKGWQEQKRREGQWEEGIDGTRNVKALVRKMTVRIGRQGVETGKVNKLMLDKRKAQTRWGRELEVQRYKDERRRLLLGISPGDVREPSHEPTRAHVLTLRRFWEGVIHSAAVP